MGRAATKFAFILAVGSLCACAGDSGTKMPEIFGWRSAGLELLDAGNSGGVHRLIRVGRTLFAMDAFTADTASASRPISWRIWKSEAGALQWSILSIPSTGVPFRWVTDSQYLYVGMRFSGEVLRYDPTRNTWKIIALPDPPASKARVWNVNTLGLFKGELVVGISPTDTNTSYCWMGGVRDSAGQKFPCIGALKNVLLDYVQEYRGALYGINRQYGIFRWTPGATSWERLTSARGRTDTAQDERVSAIGIHNDQLFVGYAGNWDGLFRWNGDGTWTNMTPKPGNGRDIQECPRDIRVIASHRGQLFMAGVAGSSVLFWVPKDTSHPAFGDWRLADDGWCNLSKYGCGDQNWGIVGMGDTLYATGWGFVAKSPLSDISKMARPVYK